MIYGLDPGPTVSALVGWTGTRVRLHAVLPNDDLLLWVVGQPATQAMLVIEEVESFGMAVGREVFTTVFWAGRFYQAWPGRATLLPRRLVKSHLCRSTRASDANVRRALLDRFGERGTKRRPGLLYGVKTHEWSALALAVTWADRDDCATLPRHGRV